MSLKALVVPATVQPVTDGTAYATGEAIGSAALIFPCIQFRETGFVLEAVTLLELDAQDFDADLVLFDRAPASTVTNNAAFDLADADGPNVLGVVTLATPYLFADNLILQVRGIGLPIVLPPGDWNLYGVLVARGAFDFGTTTANLTVKIHARAP